MKNSSIYLRKNILIPTLLLLLAVGISSCDSITNESVILDKIETTDNWCTVSNQFIPDYAFSEEIQAIVEELNFIHTTFWNKAKITEPVKLTSAIESSDLHEIAISLNLSVETFTEYNNQFIDKAGDLSRLIGSYGFEVNTNSSYVRKSISFFNQVEEGYVLLNEDGDDDGCQWGQVSACMAMGAVGSVGACGPFALLCYSAASYLCMCAYCSGDEFDEICV